MVASIGAVASPSQGASYYERDGYYAKDSPEHLAASAWAGKGAAELDLRGPVDPDTFKAVLEGEVPDGSGKRLGRRMGDGGIRRRPGRDLTFSAPKSVSLAALVGGDARVVDAHDRAVGRVLGWFETNAAETRTQDPASGRMVRTGDQKTVIATFRHETSRNLDPALHTHSVIANMLHGPDGKWRTMANESLYASKLLLGALYRSELAGELAKLGYGIERTHADGRFEIAGVSRDIIDAFSTRRAEIEAAMADRGLGATAENQHLARRAALMTRAAKRDVDRAELRGIWEKQAAELGFEAKALVAEAMERTPAGPAKARGGAKDAGKGDESTGVRQADLFEHAARAGPAREAVDWALAHLSERDAVFARTDLLAAALAYSPGAASIGEIERAVNDLQREGRLHDAPAFPGSGPGQAGSGGLTTERAVADERETIALMRSGAGRGKAPMKGWTVDRHLRKGPLTAGQKQAVRLILSEKDRTVGVQGFAGTGKTRMLNRARALAEKKGWRMVGLAPSASAVQTLTAESGIRSETLQRFLARNAGVAEGRLTKKGAKTMRAAFAKTVLVVDEGSLASTAQARDLLRIAAELRIPKLVLVGDSKQLDAVDAGKPFAQLQQAGMKTAVMDEILRQRDPDLKAAVEASLAGEIGRAFDRLGANVAEVKADNIAGAVAARWLKLSAEERERTGVMAPSHELREGINAHIRERLVREGRIAGPALETQRLVSKGYTNAEKALASNYTPGDVVAFHRPYKRLGVEKGDERRVERVDRKNRIVHLEGPDGAPVAWKPSEIGGRQGGTEVYRAETVELRAGDRIRWTRNDTGLGVVNSGSAEVLRIHNGRVTFALEDGRRLTLTPGDPQLRHLDHAWASTVHAFQGRTVDNVIAAMQANHPTLTTAKAFYVEISRARDRAELVTDDAQVLKERLEAVTGERLSALEGIGEAVQPERERGQEAVSAVKERERDRAEDSATKRIEATRGREDRAAPSSPDRNLGREAPQRKAPEPEPPAKTRVREMDLGL
ncbi:MAG: relaxase domain-containing protein [Rhodospirillaceae bacterium]|nr:relaxase domain-containing protein [Rhodospirillaceae bacterium]